MDAHLKEADGDEQEDDRQRRDHGREQHVAERIVVLGPNTAGWFCRHARVASESVISMWAPRHNSVAVCQPRREIGVFQQVRSKLVIRGEQTRIARLEESPAMQQHAGALARRAHEAAQRLVDLVMRESDTRGGMPRPGPARKIPRGARAARR